MAHAAMVQVKIEPGSDAEHRRSVLTQFVVPAGSALPGFKSGMWLSDGQGTGTCVVRFDTGAQAERASRCSPRERPPVIQAWTGEVELEA